MGGVRAVLDRELEAFYGRDYERLVASLRAKFRDEDLARESVDEAVSRAWARLADGESIDCLAAWIRTVATNVARDRLRRRTTEARHVRSTTEADTIDVSPVELIDVDLERALAGLPKRQREIATLRYVHDLSCDEIAAEIGTSSGYVRSALFRSRRALIAAVALTALVVTTFVFRTEQSNPVRVDITPATEPTVPTTSIPRSDRAGRDLAVVGDDNEPPSESNGARRDGNQSNSPAAEVNAPTADDNTTPVAPPVNGPATPNPEQPHDGGSDGYTPPPLGALPRVTATQTGSGLSVSPSSMPSGEFELLYVDARATRGSERLQFESPWPDSLWSLAHNETHIVSGLVIGDYNLCAQTCAPFSVVAEPGASEAADVVTLNVSDFGIDAPYRTVQTDGSGARSLAAPDIFTLNLRVPANASQGWEIHISAVEATPTQAPSIMGGWTALIAPGETLTLQVRTLSAVQLTGCWIPGCRLAFVPEASP